MVAVAGSNSNISNAEIDITIGQTVSKLKISAGTHDRASLFPLEEYTTDIALAIHSMGRTVTMFATHIPRDATIVIVGSDPLRFDGQIYHSHPPSPTMPTCTLRCTAASQPMNGPGCRERNVNGLIFKVCC